MKAAKRASQIKCFMRFSFFKQALTDVAPREREFDRHLFYTGMTRATESVRVLCDKTCQSTLLGWLTGRTDL
jgi:hypothetical protein